MFCAMFLSCANCWGNAASELFFSSLKNESIRKRIDKTRDLARANTFDYSKVFYNRTRRHSHIDGVNGSDQTPTKLT